MTLEGYYLAFELLGPIIELLGVVTVVAELIFGVINIPVAVLLLLAALGYGMFLSLASFGLEETSFHRYERRRDLVAGLVAAVLENVGFRQRHAWWRLRGLIDAVTRRQRGWGQLQRVGFKVEAESPDLAVTPFRASAPNARRMITPCRRGPARYPARRPARRAGRRRPGGGGRLRIGPARGERRGGARGRAAAGGGRGLAPGVAPGVRRTPGHPAGARHLELRHRQPRHQRLGQPGAAVLHGCPRERRYRRRGQHPGASSR